MESKALSKSSGRTFFSYYNCYCWYYAYYFSDLSNDFSIFQIQSNSYKKAVRRLEALESLFEKHETAKSPLIQQKLKLLNRKEELTSKIRSIKKTMRSSTVLAFKDELKARKRVLRRLGYITSDDVVELKGKVACDIRC
ncbi:DExH-box ATP-dependent RNA helicase DExH9-like [Hibiscus syriacus]|uniref:DExH-box ATP-dependent RNA helicase DExH9-like n=1 Tax=Hibiscus syriacus TaxID=106335 RepID=UPI0019248B27|nr:DExH-box ATP-dependent RNA helicase DExH9-like [Hibiscus syriacus]